ncbi:MAG: chloride channel protein, partial [Candidatus Binatia bacterium]
SAVGQVLREPPERLRTLAACGAAAGIAAVFNAPIAGAFFALEVVTRNFAMPAFSPVILSAVLATVVSRGYFGDTPAFVVQPFVLEGPWEVGIYGLLGVFTGVVAVGFVVSLDFLERHAARMPIPKLWRPAAGGLVLGFIFLWLPQLYGVGYATMDEALAGRLPWHLLLLLLPAKMLATSLTLASGGSGGVFLPALYVGSVAGGLFGMTAHALLPTWTAGSGAYALVGMAGVLAAATHTPITAILLLIEITGDYKVVLPVMIVSTIATQVGRALKQDSIYTLKFTRRGIELDRREDMILRSHTVGQVMRPPALALSDAAPLAEVVRTFLEHELSSVHVVDSAGRFVGEISIHDIKSPDVED